MTTDKPDWCAVMFADLTGFTALTDAHGDDVAAAVACRLKAMCLENLHGSARLVKTIGDAVLVVAPDPAQLLETALAMWRAAEREQGYLVLRGGLSWGACVLRDGDVFGGTVNLASRVAGHALPGQLLCTQEFAKALGQDVAVGCASLGQVALKNLPRPVELLRVLLPNSAAAPPVLDPVCRMRLEPPLPDHHLWHQGQVFHFCSAACLTKFAREPAAYARGPV